MQKYKQLEPLNGLPLPWAAARCDSRIGLSQIRRDRVDVVDGVLPVVVNVVG